jgi:hypothetical protein
MGESDEVDFTVASGKSLTVAALGTLAVQTAELTVVSGGTLTVAATGVLDQTDDDGHLTCDAGSTFTITGTWRCNSANVNVACTPTVTATTGNIVLVAGASTFNLSGGMVLNGTLGGDTGDESTGVVSAGAAITGTGTIDWNFGLTINGLINGTFTHLNVPAAGGLNVNIAGNLGIGTTDGLNVSIGHLTGTVTLASAATIGSLYINCGGTLAFGAYKVTVTGGTYFVAGTITCSAAGGVVYSGAQTLSSISTPPTGATSWNAWVAGGTVQVPVAGLFHVGTVNLRNTLTVNGRIDCLAVTLGASGSEDPGTLELGAGSGPHVINGAIDTAANVDGETYAVKLKGLVFLGGSIKGHFCTLIQIGATTEQAIIQATTNLDITAVGSEILSCRTISSIFANGHAVRLICSGVSSGQFMRTYGGCTVLGDGTGVILHKGLPNQLLLQGAGLA